METANFRAPNSTTSTTRNNYVTAEGTDFIGLFFSLALTN